MIEKHFALAQTLPRQEVEHSAGIIVKQIQVVREENMNPRPTHHNLSGSTSSPSKWSNRQETVVLPYPRQKKKGTSAFCLEKVHTL